MRLNRRTKIDTLPRYITPASIELGDTVRATWKVGDVIVSRQGVVHKREYEGSMRCFMTKEDIELFRWHPDHNEIRVTLLAKAEPKPQPVLSMFEDLDERLA